MGAVRILVDGDGVRRCGYPGPRMTHAPDNEEPLSPAAEVFASFVARCEEGEDDTQQCGGARAFSFIVHGLWPQYRRGWPDYCDVDTAYVPEELIGEMLDIMPSRRLIIHQWRKHGTCSGLDPDDYV